MAATLPSPAIGGPPPAAQPVPPRVGRVLLTGNARTADRGIPRELRLVPGAVLPDPSGPRQAEIRLLLKYHRRFGIDGGTWPVVTLVPNEPDSAFRDVMVSFPER